ncbi:hypothetical protein [Conyzicola sp.]|uniref:hypothetical protein n=1 Tax=Conyzicola sp. TaxID=1969404 RepID=UPI003988B7EE
MIPIPKPKSTIGFAIALLAGGALGFFNHDEFGRNSGLPLPVLGLFLWAVGIYLIVGSVRELQRRKRGG